MSDYTPPTLDMIFTITELADLEAVSSLSVYEESSEELVQAVLDEAGRFFCNVLAPSNKVGDEQGVLLEGNDVLTPQGFKEAYQQLVDDGWVSLPFPAEEGGQGLPELVHAAVTEMMQSANLAFSMCPLLASGAAAAIRGQASPVLKNQYIPKLASGEWAAAMSLTEPQSGSDLSGIRTKAVSKGDHYLITGQKIFISWADHDMAENIVHLVLARTPGAPIGTRGISLFLVPKYVPEQDGSLGSRNDFSVVSLEHKLGLHASPTCAVSYGDNDGAIGYLVGEENQGLAAMFLMMNHSRLQVALQGPALVERAYQQALSYAQERVQGFAKGYEGQVAIIHHPDVQRMLMTMKAGTEAMRALSYVTAGQIDQEEYSGNQALRQEIAARVSLMTPIIKGWCTEFSQELVQLALQIHGGMGYVEETGVAQYMRDARIMTIYEGTSAIQAMDLVGRKLLRDNGLTFMSLIKDMRADIQDSERFDNSMRELIKAFEHAVFRLEESAQWILENHAREEVDIGAIAFDFMMLAGVVSGGWQMTRAAVIATARLSEGVGISEFYRQKIASSLFYAEYLLPRADSYARVVLNGGGSLKECQFLIASA